MRRLVTIVLLMMSPVLTLAQGSGRAGNWDFSIGAIYQDRETSNGVGGSSLAIDDALGLGFNIGYNFTNKLSLGADFDFLRPDYTAIIVNVNDPNDTRRIDHTLSQFNGRFKGTFNFLDGPFTPFVEIGAGWTYIDSNVANGPPITGCWWDPWWGERCALFYNTFTSTDFTYGGGLGLRYEFAGGSFIRGNFSVYKLDTGSNSADPELRSFRVEYGWRF